MTQKPIKVKNEEIVKHWSKIVDESDIAVDWCDANVRCWRCARKKKTLERCHIIPESLGGTGDVNNLILLCKDCHQESPDVLESKYIWEWIKNTKADYYNLWDIQKSFSEYEKIYGETVDVSLLKAIPEKSKNSNDLVEVATSIFSSSLKSAFKSAGTHFGVGFSTGTRTFILKKSIDLIKEKPIES